MLSLTDMASRKRLRSVTAMSSRCRHGIGLTRKADKLLLWLDRRLGTLSRTISASVWL